MNQKQFDVVVLGGGPAGYVAAIRAAQKGYKTACISPQLGGTCLHEGCIPSKFLLNVSHHYYFLKHAQDFGINVEKASFDLTKIIAKKRDIIGKLSHGIAGLLKKNKVEYISQKGTIEQVSGKKIVKCEKGKTIEATKALIIATGSQITQIPFKMTGSKEQRNQYIDTSRTALEWTQCPKSLLVVGAGYIGLELASVWARLGAKVKVVDIAKDFLPFVDSDVSKTVFSSLSKQMDIDMGVGIEEYSHKNGVLSARLSNGEQWEGDKILSAVGRRAAPKNWPDAIKTDQYGFIEVNEYGQTSAEGVYAIGDIVGGALLAHKGSDEGWIAVEHLNAHNPVVEPKGTKCIPKISAIPSVIYLDPEVATIGKSEKELKNAGVKYAVNKVPFSGNGRAMTKLDSIGFVKIIAAKDTGEILGVSVVGHNAESVICQVAIAMSYGATVNDIASICYPHPSTDEVFREAAFMGSVWDGLHI